MTYTTRMLLLGALTLAACGGPGSSTGATCTPGLTPSGCGGEFQCEVLTGQTVGRCFPPAYVLVTVTNPTKKDAAVAGARFVAIDAATNVSPAAAVITASDGSARIPVRWPRPQPDTAPSHPFYIRVSAPGYAEYPGVRQSPLAITAARDPTKVLEPAQANIKLVPLAQTLTGVISGTVVATDGQTPAGGVLVVAETKDVPPVGYSSVSDGDGAFSIVGVQSGTYEVVGYFAGRSFPQSNVSVSGGEVQNVKLIEETPAKVGTVSGSVAISGASAPASTTVALQIYSTGDVVPGLTVVATSVNPFQLPGVASGTYLAVAGYGNDDGLVVSPASPPQPFSTTGALHPLTTPLAVVTAVAIVSPGGTGNVDLISTAPTFHWSDYPGATSYALTLWDISQPDQVWTLANVTTTSLTYDDPTYPVLKSGGIYQWMVAAYGAVSVTTALSHSEDQLGLFENAKPAK